MVLMTKQTNSTAYNNTNILCFIEYYSRSPLNSGIGVVEICTGVMEYQVTGEGKSRACVC